MPDSNDPNSSTGIPEKKTEFKGTTMREHKTSYDDDVTALIRETLASVDAAGAEPARPSLEDHQMKGTPFASEVPLKSIPRMESTPISASKTAAPARPAEKSQRKSDGSAPAAEVTPYDATFKEYHIGDVVAGTVVKIDPRGALVDIHYNAEAFLPSDEVSRKSFSSISDVLKVGDTIKVCIMELETKEGYVSVSKKRADSVVKWDTASEAFKNKTVLEGSVTSAVRGGLVVDCDGIRGFIPASQVLKSPDVPLESFVGKVLPVKILEIDLRQGKVVLSHKQAASEKVKGDVSKILEELEVGQVRHGHVTSVKKFGAFVDLGGVEGLIHVTEMAWRRVNHPSDVVKMGDEIDVFVLGVDKEEKKVALGLRQLQADPWVEASKLFPVGSLVQGKISRMTKFGAFVDLDHNLEGLVHISELSVQPVARPEDAAKIGDTVTMKVLRVIPEEQKIGLSIREAILDQEREQAKRAAPPAAPTPTIGDAVGGSLSTPPASSEAELSGGA